MRGLRYESPACMPQGMRQRVTPVMLGEAIREHRKEKKVQIDGIHFGSGRAAARYLYLMDAQERGIIADLRIRERVTIQEPFVHPGGEQDKGVFYISDFSYVVADGFVYRDGFRADDLAIWEAISEQAEDERVFEFAKGVRETERKQLQGKGILWLEV